MAPEQPRSGSIRRYVSTGRLKNERGTYLCNCRLARDRVLTRTVICSTQLNGTFDEQALTTDQRCAGQSFEKRHEQSHDRRSNDCVTTKLKWYSLEWQALPLPLIITTQNPCASICNALFPLLRFDPRFTPSPRREAPCSQTNRKLRITLDDDESPSPLRRLAVNGSLVCQLLSHQLIRSRDSPSYLFEAAIG